MALLAVVCFLTAPIPLGKTSELIQIGSNIWGLSLALPQLDSYEDYLPYEATATNAAEIRLLIRPIMN